MGVAVIQPGWCEPLYVLNSANNNIPTAYNSTAGSEIRVTTGPATKNHFAIINYTAAALAISLNGGTTDHFVVPAAINGVPSTITMENVVMGNLTSIRSLSGSIVSTGIVYLSVW